MTNLTKRRGEKKRAETGREEEEKHDRRGYSDSANKCHAAKDAATARCRHGVTSRKDRETERRDRDRKRRKRGAGAAS